MDQELETFVSLLNKNRARPVPDELAHLPNWAQRAFSQIPEPAAPRRAATNDAAPESKPVAIVAVEHPAPMAPVEVAPPRRAVSVADIVRALEAAAPLDSLMESAWPALTPAPRPLPPAPRPLPMAPLSFDPVPVVVAKKVEPKRPPPAREKVDPAPAIVEKIAAAPAAAPKVVDAAKPPAVTTAVIGDGSGLPDPPTVSDKTEPVAAAPPAAKATPHGAVAKGLAAVGVIAVVALVAGGYWYANRSGLSLARDTGSLARNSISLARNVMAMIPPMPAVPKLFSGKFLPDVSALTSAAIMPVMDPMPKAVASADPKLGKLAAPTATAKPAVDGKADDTAPMTVTPATGAPASIAQAKAPAKETSFNQIAMLGGRIPAAAPPAPKKMSATGEEPTWLRNAVTAPPYSGLPQIAIVIDDLGIDSDRTQRAIALNGAVTLSFLAYASNLPEQAEAARKAGHELIVHVPMEPIVRPKFISASTNGAGLEHDELLRRLRWDLSRFSGYVGVNNHMGNRLATDPESAQTVVAELKARGLLFLDTRGGNGGVFAVAERMGVPTVSRDVFLDDDVGAASINERLATLENVARAQGTAIAIAHPHDRTLDSLRVWLASLSSKGLQLVPLTAIVKDREQHIAGAN